MRIVWAAIIIAAALTVFISFQIDDISIKQIINLSGFFILSILIIVEILKWPLGKRMIDNSKGLASYVFGDTSSGISWGYNIFTRESIISIKGKGTFGVRASFIASLIGIAACLLQIFQIDF